jgi:hypothetical protein
MNLDFKPAAGILRQFFIKVLLLPYFLAFPGVSPRLKNHCPSPKLALTKIG